MIMLRVSSQRFPSKLDLAELLYFTVVKERNGAAAHFCWLFIEALDKINISLCHETSTAIGFLYSAMPFVLTGLQILRRSFSARHVALKIRNGSATHKHVGW